jgi:phage shock protein PspC (stress-responsive transcriptional regulator)
MSEKKLYRSSSGKKLAGVCAGMSDYFELDVTIIRLLWVAAIIFGFGSGIILYLLCWLIIPEQPY